MLWFVSFYHSMKRENTNVKSVLSSSGTKTIPCGRGCADGRPSERFVAGCLVSHPEAGESADGKISIVFKVGLHILVSVLCVCAHSHTRLYS